MPKIELVTKNCGHIDPRDINTYLACRGFEGLSKAVKSLRAEDTIEEIKKSVLLGRGGAGFPTGKKWEFTRAARSKEKYLICNADEGEMGTFKDRFLLEKDPFTLIEGIAIASYAIGAKKAFIYLRAEYASLLGLINNAIEQAKPKIKESLELDIEVCVGQGAYVCGEETALIESIEGKRGEARFRPPFPPSKGLWNKPTAINNVETLMNIPQIIINGADWFKGIGTEKSKGSKVFSVCGDVDKQGVYELSMGSSLKELLDLAGARDTKMVQVGGASGRIITENDLGTPLSFETVLGSGGVIVYNKSRGVVEAALKTMEFFKEESCGKCVPCREGTTAMLNILDRLNQKKGRAQDMENLETISYTMSLASLCGLGQAAPNIVVDTLQKYKEEYLIGVES